jgi:hypothetical protein
VVARCTLPLRDDDAISRVLADHVRIGVQDNDLGEVSVEVLEVLDDTVRARPGRLPEELVGDEEVVRVQLLKDGRGGVVMLSGPDDDLVELGEVSEEVIYTRTFGGAPAVLTLLDDKNNDVSIVI